MGMVLYVVSEVLCILFYFVLGTFYYISRPYMSNIGGAWLPFRFDFEEIIRLQYEVWGF